MRKIPVMIPYFDEDEEVAAIEAIKSGWVAQGPKVKAFEKKVAEHENIRNGVATSSCTAALHLAMVASGVREGFDVMVPSFTFVATVNSIIESGGTPILIDVKKETFNIDVEDIEKKIEENYNYIDRLLINKQTNNILWGMVPVHQFGLCADMPKINDIANRYNLKVIEDAACALGAKIHNTHEGEFGNTSCISLHPRKSITTGEGGMILTDDDVLSEKTRELRSHGNSVSADFRHKEKGFLLPKFNEVGFNYRMTDIQGAIGLSQINKLDYIIEEKRKKAAIYRELIHNKVDGFILPIEPIGYLHTYQSFVCMLNYEALGFDSIEEGSSYRNNILMHLEERGISTRQGTHAVHTLGYHKEKFGFKACDFPISYECDKLSITLPLYVQMTEDDQEFVVKNIIELMNER